MGLENIIFAFRSAMPANVPPHNHPLCPRKWQQFGEWGLKEVTRDHILAIDRPLLGLCADPDIEQPSQFEHQMGAIEGVEMKFLHA